MPPPPPSAGVRVLSVVLAVLYFLIHLVVIALTLLWRLVSGIAILLIDVALAVWNNKILAISLLLVFGVGLLPQKFGPETRIGLDVIYECGVYPAAQGLGAALHTIFRVPWEWIATRWNDIVLLIIEAFTDLISELRMLSRINKIKSPQRGWRAITEKLVGGGLADFLGIIADIFGFVGLIIGVIGETLTCLIDVLMQLLTSMILTRNIVSQGCIECALDPPDDRANLAVLNCSDSGNPGYTDHRGACFARQPRAEVNCLPNCDECHDYLPDLVGCLGTLIDFFTGEGGGTRIFRAVGGVFSRVMGPPRFILYGIIEHAVTNDCISITGTLDITSLSSPITLWWIGGLMPPYDCTPGGDAVLCCGKPSGCDFPGPSNKDGKDLPIGIIPALGELIAALSDDNFNDIIELILAFFFKIIDDIIRTGKRVVACFALPEFTTCIDKYPGDGSSANVDGECWYDMSDTGFEFVIPDNGLHQCLDVAVECMDNATEAPTLQPLFTPTNILEGILVFTTRASIDLAVCPFAVAQYCLDPGTVPTVCLGTTPGLDELACRFQCIRDTNPMLGWLGFLADVLNTLQGVIDTVEGIVSNLQSAVSAIQSNFACLRRCGISEWLQFEEARECIAGEGGDGCDDAGLKTDMFGHMAADHSAPVTQEAREGWRNLLQDVLHVPRSSFCGYVLYDTMPNAVPHSEWGNYLTYRACLAMHIGTRSLEKDCNYTGTVDSLGSGAEALRACAKNGPPANASGTLSVLFNATGHAGTVSIPPMFMAPIQMAQSLKNATAWSIYADVIQPMWTNFQKTDYFARGSEFFTAYSGKLSAHDALPPGSSERTAVRAELDELYLNFANDFLRRVRTRKWRNETVLAAAEDDDDDSSNASVSRITEYVGASGVEYRELTLDKLRGMPDEFFDSVGGTTERITAGAMSEETQEAWDAVNDHLHIEYWPAFQAASGAMHAIRRRRGADLLGMMTGRLKFLASRGEFVTPHKFKSLARAGGYTGTSPRMPLTEMALRRGLSLKDPYNVRSTGRVYAPFPIPIDHEAPEAAPWVAKTGGYLAQIHREKNAQRASASAAAAAATGKSPRQEADFDANQWLYDLLDGIWNGIMDVLGMFGVAGTRDLVNSFVGNTVEFFDTFDLENFTESNIEQKFRDFFKCAVPENIDGTDIYSPFCGILVPEALFALFDQVDETNESFPPQIQWPQELISVNCTNVYNGDPDLFEFELSDNCPGAPWENRPFCGEGCDYCMRDYTTCTAVGSASDILDTALYITAIIPRAIDEAVEGGLDVKVVVEWWGAILAFVLIGKLIVYVMFIVPIIWLPQQWVPTIVALVLLHFVPWILKVFFGSTLPWGLVVVVVTGAVLSRLPGSFSEIIKKYGAILGILGLYTVIWLLSLVFVFPKFAEFFNINQALADVLKVFDDIILFSFIDWKPLRARVGLYVFAAGEEIPGLLTHCFLWNWGNIGLLGFLILFVVVPTVRFVVIRVLLPAAIAALQLIVLILDLRSRIRLIQLRGAVNRLKRAVRSSAEKVKGRFRKYHEGKEKKRLKKEKRLKKKKKGVPDEEAAEGEPGQGPEQEPEQEKEKEPEPEPEEGGGEEETAASARIANALERPRHRRNRSVVGDIVIGLAQDESDSDSDSDSDTTDEDGGAATGWNFDSPRMYEKETSGSDYGPDSSGANAPPLLPLRNPPDRRTRSGVRRRSGKRSNKGVILSMGGT